MYREEFYLEDDTGMCHSLGFKLDSNRSGVQQIRLGTKKGGTKTHNRAGNRQNITLLQIIVIALVQ